MIFEKISSSKPIMIAIDFEKVLSHADSNSVFGADVAASSPRTFSFRCVASDPRRAVGREAPELDRQRKSSYAPMTESARPEDSACSCTES